MMKSTNRQLRLAARPVGLPDRTDWRVVEEPAREPGDGEFLVEVLYISLDPAMRGWMTDRKSYVPPIAIGDVMRARAVGRVIASRHPGFAAGDNVAGGFGVQEYALSNGKGATIVDTRVAPLPVHLGTLGMTGMTAYFGLLDVGKPRAGNTVVVSGAAGAVGMVAGQIAKIKGCRAIGIAGGPEKCRFIVEELGFDVGIDYKKEDVAARLKELCPDAIDVYFDNVGGDVLDAALAQLARGARVVICGAISQYNNTTPFKGPSNYFSLVVNRASMTGMLVLDYADRLAEATREMAGWLADGRLKSREQIVRGGVETFPDALLKLFRGENTGKLILALTDA